MDILQFAGLLRLYFLYCTFFTNFRMNLFQIIGYYILHQIRIFKIEFIFLVHKSDSLGGVRLSSII